eukprot:CAMPEP_0195519758 /NCGR_PEP_ID=MMETSP0794_2-20130614/15426_1 /TAXON_ID=515487 /ORGANISM="Stephanopyxis turris, Strain CCMP 815" /LENGTH=193 /DNA_ID=CAMNT_0040648965 /DNA_START=103 /DNA_END=685 /DNA_ORIENTATION=-
MSKAVDSDRVVRNFLRGIFLDETALVDYSQQQLRRHLDDEEVSYWRNRAGWYDDDASMKQYNENAMEGGGGGYYNYESNSGGGSGSGSGGGSMSGATGSGGSGSFFGNAVGVTLLVISIVALFLIGRAIRRKMSKQGGGTGERPTVDPPAEAEEVCQVHSRDRRAVGGAGAEHVLDPGFAPRLRHVENHQNIL